MIVYRVTRDDDGRGCTNFPWAFCLNCGHSVGSYCIPDWKFCPWCGHKFGRRRHENVTYEQMMRKVKR